MPVPTPGPDEVLIRVEATPINPSDIGLLFGAAVGAAGALQRDAQVDHLHQARVGGPAVALQHHAGAGIAGHDGGELGEIGDRDAARVAGEQILREHGEAERAVRALHPEIAWCEVSCRTGDGLVRFRVGVYDAALPLVIDPVTAVGFKAAVGQAVVPVRLHTGINAGPVIMDGDDVYGTIVNIADMQPLSETWSLTVARQNISLDDGQSCSAARSIGERKLALYGEDFLAVIAEHADTDEAGTETMNSTAEASLDLFRQGMTVEQIGKRRGLKPATIYQHLIQAIEAGQADALEVTGLHEADAERIKTAWRSLPAEQHASLKSLFEALDGRIDYDKLRCIRASWREINPLTT